MKLHFITGEGRRYAADRGVSVKRKPVFLHLSLQARRSLWLTTTAWVHHRDQKQKLKCHTIKHFQT